MFQYHVGFKSDKPVIYKHLKTSFFGLFVQEKTSYIIWTTKLLAQHVLIVHVLVSVVTNYMYFYMSICQCHYYTQG